MVGYELRVSFLIKFMVIVSTVNLSKFFMLRTNFALLGIQPARHCFLWGQESWARPWKLVMPAGAETAREWEAESKSEREGDGKLSL